MTKKNIKQKPINIQSNENLKTLNLKIKLWKYQVMARKKGKVK